MDIVETLKEYETAHNPQYKDQLLGEMLKEDSKFVKSLGPSFVGHAHNLARQGVIKLPEGF